MGPHRTLCSLLCVLTLAYPIRPAIFGESVGIAGGVFLMDGETTKIKGETDNRGSLGFFSTLRSVKDNGNTHWLHSKLQTTTKRGHASNLYPLSPVISSVKIGYKDTKTKRESLKNDIYPPKLNFKALGLPSGFEILQRIREIHFQEESLSLKQTTFNRSIFRPLQPRQESTLPLAKFALKQEMSTYRDIHGDTPNILTKTLHALVDANIDGQNTQVSKLVTSIPAHSLADPPSTASTVSLILSTASPSTSLSTPKETTSSLPLTSTEIPQYTTVSSRAVDGPRRHDFLSPQKDANTPNKQSITESLIEKVTEGSFIVTFGGKRQSRMTDSLPVHSPTNLKFLIRQRRQIRLLRLKDLKLPESAQSKKGEKRTRRSAYATPSLEAVDNSSSKERQDISTVAIDAEMASNDVTNRNNYTTTTTSTNNNNNNNSKDLSKNGTNEIDRDEEDLLYVKITNQVHMTNTSRFSVVNSDDVPSYVTERERTLSDYQTQQTTPDYSAMFEATSARLARSGITSRPGSYYGHVSTFEDFLPRQTLHIGGFFELSGPYPGNGQSDLDAVLLAIQHVNDQYIIPGYRLQLLYNDSKCDPGVGTDAFYDFIYRKSNESSLLMVMGSACTEVTKTIAEIVPYWNLLLISYAATSPALSEREKYRTFFRLALSDSALNPARRMLIKHFLWDKVAVLYEDLESMSLAFNGINKDFTSHGIAIKSSTSFKDALVEVPGKLEKLKEEDVRIIIGGFSGKSARQVFCEAFKQGLYGPRYVWILVGSLKNQWWAQEVKDTECTCAELSLAVEGAFGVSGLDGLLGGGRSVANLTSREFQESYTEANGSRPMSVFAASSYDTVWTMALTVRRALEQWSENESYPSLGDQTYDNMTHIKETFISTMEGLEFPGVSGHVSFQGSDREGISVVYQVQGGNFTQVAIHQPSSTDLNFRCAACQPVKWEGGRVPKDEQVVVLRLLTIKLSVFYTSTGFCLGGIVLAVCFLSYNLYYERLKYIKLSSPKLNNAAVVGCILVYTAVILLGLDDRLLTDRSFSLVCSGRAFLLAAGFSLAFGAMFAKTFRVHQIFTRARHSLVKSKLIQDTHLLVIIGVLLAVDSAMVFVWVLVDPMSRHLDNTTREVSSEDEDLIYQDQLTTCHSDHLQKWLAAFYAYKGLLLVFGVYMAWETRHVKIPALNDSQYIGLNVYNVVIMSVSVVVISNFLSSQPTLAYAMEAAFIILSTTVTLCLLFVPKIYAIVTSGGNPIIASTGILVDNSNTRRFVFDERKDIFYRAEVRNRVYKRELAELDHTIKQLQHLAQLPLQLYPRLTEELMYLLPETAHDGTPTFHKRYKKRLDKCISISDEGEEVSYDRAENPDILIQLALGTTLRSLTPLSSSDTPSLIGVPSTHQLLARTNSYRDTGKHKKRKGAKAHKSPNRHGLTALASSVSNLDFLKYYRAQESGSETEDKKCENAVVEEMKRANRTRHSDELLYASPTRKAKVGKQCPLQRKESSSVPRLDKVSQNSEDSPSKRNGDAGYNGQICGTQRPVGSLDLNVTERCTSCRNLSQDHAGKRGTCDITSSRSHSCIVQAAQTLKTQEFSNSSCEHLLAPTLTKQAKSGQFLSPNDMRPHALLSPKHSMLFTVRHLHVESVDDENTDDSDSSSQSNRTDDESDKTCSLRVEELDTGHFSSDPNCKEKQAVNAQSQFETEIFPSSCSQSTSNMQHVFQIQETTERKKSDTKRTSTPKIPRKHHVNSKRAQALSGDLDISCLLTHNNSNAKAESETTTPSLVLTNTPKYADLSVSSTPTQTSQSISSSEPIRLKSENSFNLNSSAFPNNILINGEANVDIKVTNPQYSNRKRHLQSQSIPHVSNFSDVSRSLKTSHLNLDIPAETLSSQAKPKARSHQSPNSASLPLRQRSKLRPSVALPPPPPTPPPRQGAHHRIHRAKQTNAVVGLENNKLSHVPLKDLSKKSNHVYPTDKINHSGVQFFLEDSSFISAETTLGGEQNSSAEQNDEEKTGRNSSEDGLSVRQESKGATQQVGVERKKRIKKLREDLVRISKELQDLNDLGYDVSEV